MKPAFVLIGPIKNGPHGVVISVGASIANDADHFKNFIIFHPRPAEFLAQGVLHWPAESRHRLAHNDGAHIVTNVALLKKPARPQWKSHGSKEIGLFHSAKPAIQLHLIGPIL